MFYSPLLPILLLLKELAVLVVKFDLAQPLYINNINNIDLKKIVFLFMKYIIPIFIIFTHFTTPR